MLDIFTAIYKTNFWKDKHSASGSGSNLAQTETIRQLLPDLLEGLHIETLLDVPCGDYFWFKEMNIDLEWYIGADIVPEIVKANQKYRDKNHTFLVRDVTTDLLPKADMIFCRDLLGHFTNANVMRALQNFKTSGSKWLVATTFPGRNPNQDLDFDGQWRPIDLEALRYGLGPARLLLNENCGEAMGKFNDKSLGLWEL